MSYLLRFLVFSLLLCAGYLSAFAAFAEETVYFDVPDVLEPSPIPDPTAQLLALVNYPDDDDRLTLVARLYVPDPLVHGDGPYPTVVILHGSGGLWSSDFIANGLISQFEQWGELLVDLGYLVCFPDSYNPRGIPENFGGRKPHYDPLEDDHLCSPNYERPKDVIAALTYLQGRSDVDSDNVGLMGFSHGAQTAINAVVDESVDLGQYSVSYVDLDEVPNTNPVEYEEDDDAVKNVDSPVRIGNLLPFPKVCVFYYGGGSHYRYHGQASSPAAGRYMFDRRTKVLLFHGTEDNLLGVDNPDAALPLTGNLFPMKQVLASSAQAAVEGVDDPLQHHFIFDGVGHSFDLVTSSAEIDWNTDNETAAQKAKRLARDEVLKWFELCLKPGPIIDIETGDDPQQDIDLTTTTRVRLAFQWKRTLNLEDSFQTYGESFVGDGDPAVSELVIGEEGTQFFRLEYNAIEPPFETDDNIGFFLQYDDFDY